MRGWRWRWGALVAVTALLWIGCDGQAGDDDDAADDDAADDDDVMDDDDDTGDDDTGEFGDPIEQLDTYDGPEFAELLEAVTWGDRIAFCSGVQGLNLYDAADPEDLQVLDGSIGFDVGSQAYPRCQHLAVDEDGDRIYVAAHSDQTQTTAFIAVMDASDPTAVAQVGALELEEEAEGLAVSGDLLLVAAHGDGLLVFERGDGGDLTELTRVGGFGNAWSVRAANDLAYVPDGDGALAVVDISDPAAAAMVGSLELPGAPRHVALDGDRAVVALGGGGFALVSLEDREQPLLLEVEDTPGSALEVAWGDDAVYVADWNDIRVYDLSDRDDARLVGREPLPQGAGPDSRTLGIAGRGDVIFSSNWTAMVSYRYHPGLEAPDLVSSGLDVLLPAAGPGNPGEGGVTLSNHGTRDLELEGVTLDPGLSVSGLPEVLEAGDDAWLTITLEPDDTAEYTGTVAVLSNDPDQPALELTVRANGSGTGIGDDLSHLSFVDRDGAVVDLAALEGSVVFLDYFATF
jgi:hypothetical protein